jgi:hypothetical protein
VMATDHGKAVAVAVGVTGAVAVPVALEVAVAVVGCSSVVAGWGISTVVVGALAVRSLGARGSDGGFVAAPPVRSSTKAESNVERVRAATIAPTSTTGARTAVRGNSAHAEWPAWVRLRTR